MPRMRGVYSEASDGADETGCSGLRRASKGSRGRRSSAVDEASLNESALDYSPEEFELSELVLARNPLRQDTWWPGIILDPSTEAPDHVRRQRQRDKPLCVMFYGPGSQHRTRDFTWASGDGDILPLSEFFEELKRTRESRPSRGEDYVQAIDEVTLVKRGLRDRTAGALNDVSLAGRGHGRHHGPTHCVSCESPLDNFEVSNARQLNGRCSGCHDLYRKGNYCPVCEKVWRPTDNDMVGCDTCSFWVHAHCDRLAGKVMSAGEEMDYFCPQCRKARNIHNRLAALQQAELAVRSAEPRQTRTAFQLFAAEIHRQYKVDSRVQDLKRFVGDTWRSLTVEERGPYESAAQQDMARFLREKRNLEELQRRYAELRFAAEQDGIIDQDGEPIRLPKVGGQRPHSAGPSGTRTTAGGHWPGGPTTPRGGVPSHQRAGSGPQRTMSGPQQAPKSSGSKRMRREAREESPDYVPQPSKRKRERGPSPPPPRIEPAAAVQSPTADAATVDVPEEIPVFCNSINGLLLLRRQRVICQCNECSTRPEAKREFSCTQFEQHCGAGSAKKWKASLRIAPGGVPEVPPGSLSMPVGKWMEVIGMDIKPAGGRSAPVAPSSMARPTNPHQQSLTMATRPSPLPQPPPAKQVKMLSLIKREPVKREEREALAVFEPWLDIARGNFKPIKVRWAGDRCSVCDSDVDFDFDQLVSCDQCGITVHQSCYGVPELPGEDDLWLCRACEFKEEGEEYPQCCLCPISGGALKKTTVPDLWCHAACMQWIPEVTVEDMNRMEPISHIKSIQKERWDLNCSVCKQRVGAKIQCSSCYAAYHPLCARIAGLHMEMVDPEGSSEGLRLISYCARHCKPKPQMSGLRLASKEEEAQQQPTGDDGNGLWNAQLFPPPALVPVPECSSGCARQEAIQSQGWQRISHGTGMGHSSTTGYWIPKKPAYVPAPAKPKPPKLIKRRGSGVAFGRGRPRASRAAEGALDIDAEGANTEISPEELLPLLEGVPEEIPVHCNGRSALLVIRTQRVLFNGQDMSASKFELTCGKGDAKKWKCSLWLEDENGEPVMMMQDWLAEKKLDRKLLANLAANLANVEAYQQFQEAEAASVVGDLLDAVCGEAQEEGKKAPAADHQPLPWEQAFRGTTNGTETLTAQDAAQAGLQKPADTATTPLPARKQGPVGMEIDQAAATQHDGQSLLEAKALLRRDRQDGGLQPTSGAHLPAEQATQNVAPLANGHSSPETAGASPADVSKEERDDTAAVSSRAVDALDCGEDMEPDLLANPGSLAASEQLDDSAHGGPGEPGSGAPCDGAEIQSPGTAVEKLEAEDLSRLRLRQGPALRPTVTPADTAKPGPKAPEPKGPGPEAVLGQQCEVHFPEDKEWYKAVVRGYDRASKLHNLWYFYDEEAEWIDLLEEDRAGRMRWANPKMSANLRSGKNEKKAKPPPVIAQTALNGEAPPVGEAAAGWRVSVWWKDDMCFYAGLVQGYSAESGRHKVLYDDGEVEHLVLSAESVRWDKQPPGYKAAESRKLAPQALPLTRKEETSPAPQGLSPEEEKEEEEARQQRASSAPATVRVVCNSMRALFHVQRSAIEMENGQLVSPTEFERISGKAASKKWKASIRIDKGNGSPGVTIGDWLVDKGLDAPRAPRMRSDAGAMRQQQRQNLAMRSAITQQNRGAGRQGHRESCMCVICKQSRRTGKPWAGMLGGPAAPVWIPPQSAATTTVTPQSRKLVGPVARFGKRAFVRCTPQLVRGVTRKQPWQVPKSRMYTAEEWEALHRETAEAGSKLNRQSVVSEDDAVKLEAMVVKQEGSLTIGKAPKERKGLTLKERLEICQATERQRLTFCKSGIHGWGLIAKQEMKQDSMIIEYRGESVRRAMADAREKVYRVKDMDCYLFNINDDAVVDATVKGTIGRFTNHCCSPSMYTKVLEVDGQPHLVFFARQDIKIGQELTYDYRFKEEEGENKLVCQCGAPNCRGTMN